MGRGDGSEPIGSMFGNSSDPIGQLCLVIGRVRILTQYRAEKGGF